MRKLVVLVGLVLLVAGVAAAQDTPKAEIFGGYSYLRTSVAGSSFNSHGASGEIALNVNNHFGFVGDIGFYKPTGLGGASATIVTYLFGPQITSRSNEKITPFVHALFGGAHASASITGGSASANAFAMAFGGGIDVKAGSHIAIRIVQGDYVYTKFNDGINNHQNSFRLSAGIVFRAGTK